MMLPLMMIFASLAVGGFLMSLRGQDLLKSFGRKLSGPVTAPARAGARLRQPDPVRPARGFGRR